MNFKKKSKTFLKILEKIPTLSGCRRSCFYNLFADEIHLWSFGIKSNSCGYSCSFVHLRQILDVCRETKRVHLLNLLWTILLTNYMKYDLVFSSPFWNLCKLSKTFYATFFSRNVRSKNQRKKKMFFECIVVSF